jgi:folate-binding protein YgfZ
MGSVSRQRLILAAIQHNLAGITPTLAHVLACPNYKPPMSSPTHAQTLLIEGPDAMAFAQAQFSSHVDALEIGCWQFSAWLDAQGRVRALFHLARLSADRLLLLLRGGDSGVMAGALQPFVFRSKVRLGAANSCTLAQGAAMPLHEVRAEGALVHLGAGDHQLSIVMPDAANDDWQLTQLRAGWPWLAPGCLDAFVPASLSLHRLRAVAIDKGCYPGQEIVARMHFRGASKRHLHRVILSQAAMAGDTVRIDDREVGRLLDVVSAEAGIEALAVLSDEFADAAGSGVLQAVEGELSLHIVQSWPA